ncbi:dipeptidase [Acidobacteriota bacterium]
MKKILIALTILIILVGFNNGFILDEFPDMKKANKIHSDALVFDAHAHPMIYLYATPEKLELGKKTDMSQMDFITMKEGGLDAVFLSLPLVGDDSKAKPTEKILNNIGYIREQLKKYSDLAELALSSADIRRIHRAGKRAIILSIEYTSPLEGRVESLKTYYDSGVRLITVGHTKIDRIADSVSDREGNKGLSQFGKEVIKEMNRLGMVIDITHTGDNLQRAIIRESQAPVVASHSCARAIHRIPRNVPDSIMKEIAKKGGAVMSTFYSGHLSSQYTAKRREVQKVYDQKRKELEAKYKDDNDKFIKELLAMEKKILPQRVEMEILMEHIDHTIKTAGINHVGFGSDFGGIDNPIGLESAEGLPKITYNLLKRGYDEKDIKKFLGGNLLRVLEEVERVARAVK